MGDDFLKVIAESDSNSYISVKAFGGGGEGMPERKISQELKLKAKDLNDSEHKIWELCLDYIDDKLKEDFEKYEIEFFKFKDLVYEVKEIHKRDLKDEIDIKLLHEHVCKFNALEPKRPIERWLEIKDEERKGYLKKYEFILKETKRLISNKFEYFKDDFDENNTIKDLSMEYMFNQISTLREILYSYITNRVFVAGEILEQMHEEMEKLEKELEDKIEEELKNLNKS